LKELGDAKQKDKDGYFGGWFGGSKNKGDELITEEDRK
jgi:hypothetical protein